MALSNELISRFVKVTNDDKKPEKETIAFGEVAKIERDSNGNISDVFVRLDGSDILTPLSRTTDVVIGDRVIVMIKNHSAVITGNLTSPSARVEYVKVVEKQVVEAGEKITEFEYAIADHVTTEQLAAEQARIDDLEVDTAVVKKNLEVANADIAELVVENIEITEQVNANKAAIENMEASNLTVEKLDARYAAIEDLNATNAEIDRIEATQADFNIAVVEDLTALDAKINELDAESLSTKYANIDFSNIGEAAIREFYAKSGIIEDLVIESGVISGKLVGVTISGDLIEGNTVKAEKLVVRGEDGLYYKLNTDGMTVEAEQTDENSLNGSIIKAKSITATKINVSDLVAFDATIGGFKITEDSIYSGVKESVHNTTQGTYMDSTGQLALGDTNRFIKYYKADDGTWKLEIAADNFVLTSSNRTIQEEINTLKDEVTTNLRIESSRGTVFKNDSIATVLSVVIYRGSQRITDMPTLRAAMGNSVYLQWKWQRLDDDSFGIISSSDSRLSNDGFTLTISPGDVDTKVTFMCELIV